MLLYLEHNTTLSKCVWFDRTHCLALKAVTATKSIIQTSYMEWTRNTWIRPPRRTRRGWNLVCATHLRGKFVLILDLTLICVIRRFLLFYFCFYKNTLYMIGRVIISNKLNLRNAENGNSACKWFIIILAINFTLPTSNNRANGYYKGWAHLCICGHIPSNRQNTRWN